MIYHFIFIFCILFLNNHGTHYKVVPILSKVRTVLLNFFLFHYIKYAHICILKAEDSSRKPVFFPSSCGTQKVNSGHQACMKVLLPACLCLLRHLSGLFNILSKVS